MLPLSLALYLNPQDVKEKYDKICEEAYSNARKETHIKYKDWLDSPWSGFFEGKDPLRATPTGCKEDTLVHIGKRFSSPPPNAAEFVIHKGEVVNKSSCRRAVNVQIFVISLKVG